MGDLFELIEYGEGFRREWELSENDGILTILWIKFLAILSIKKLDRSLCNEQINQLPLNPSSYRV